MQIEVLEYQEEEELHEGGRQEVATCSHDASKNVEGACSRNFSHGKVKTEETDGNCNNQKEYNLLVFLHGGIRP